MPIFSLPSKYGIGDFGSESYRFVDFLAQAGQSLWQILPLVQTGFGNSPYSSVSSSSFNPYFISLEFLKIDGLITKKELDGAKSNEKYINYGKLYAQRYPLLERAFERFDKDNEQFKAYLKSKESLDYALFMAIKKATGHKPFCEWEEGLRCRDKKALTKFARENEKEILFWQFLQFMAKKQWSALKKYANEKGISIIGDLPLYVALDSVDVWVNPKLYKLDQNYLPKKVAGVPPDYFCEDGQLWGNPVYDYDEHKRSEFKWWTERIKRTLKVFDYVRIDHFRGLDRYYQISPEMPNAKVGEWVDVPSKELFSAIHKKVKKDRIIAEDLGIIDDGVRELLKWTGYPGMKILSFAFNGDENNLYLPQNIEENSVCYTGTHDNDTLIGLIENSSEWDYTNLVGGVKNSLRVLKMKKSITNKRSLANAIIELGMGCRSKTFIIPMQDLAYLSSEYRINEPGTMCERNWAIKLDKKVFSSTLVKKLFDLTKKYKRI